MIKRYLISMVTGLTAGYFTSTGIINGDYILTLLAIPWVIWMSYLIISLVKIEKLLKEEK